MERTGPLTLIELGGRPITDRSRRATVLGALRDRVNQELWVEPERLL